MGLITQEIEITLIYKNRGDSMPIQQDHHRQNLFRDSQAAWRDGYRIFCFVLLSDFLEGDLY